MVVIPTIFEMESCGSTMDEAKRYILSHGNIHDWDSGASIAFITKYQESGRGRFPKRQWVSPKGLSLLTTIVLSPSAIGVEPHLFSLYIGYLLRNVLEKQGAKATIKWPNDVLCNGKKISGILCQQIVMGKKLLVSCGIGLNLLQKHFCDNPIIAFNNEEKYLKQKFEPTSLFLETKNEVMPKVILNDLLSALSVQAKVDWLKELQQQLYGIEHEIVFLVGDESNCGKKKFIEGRYVGIGQNGGILIKQKKSEEVDIKEFVSGEIVKIFP